MTSWADIADAIGNATRSSFALAHAIPLGGGDINRAFRLEGSDGAWYFVKLNDAKRLPMFAAEQAGLEAIAATRTIRVPKPVAHGISNSQAFLALEYLDIEVGGDARQLGEQLAALHRTSAERFGFALDNTIGSTPQPNAWSADWITFWRDQRLGYQLRLAARNGFGSRLQELGAGLLEKLPQFFCGYTPQPSLLHGDLWSGNHAYLGDGTPVIFDPAPYYGDREADLAMTELFGGFPPEFYRAYNNAWPLDDGYELRKTLYNLYHILNHANLFGGGYARQAEGIMRKLLDCVGTH